jgi:tryptophanyl-tRNA synthetase
MNLLGIYAALADRPLEAVLDEFAGSEFSRFKDVLADLMIATVGRIGGEMRRLQRDPGEIDAVLRRGVEAARKISEPIMREVHDIVGFLRP